MRLKDFLAWVQRHWTQFAMGSRGMPACTTNCVVHHNVDRHAEASLGARSDGSKYPVVVKQSEISMDISSLAEQGVACQYGTSRSTEVLDFGVGSTQTESYCAAV